MNKLMELTQKSLFSPLLCAMFALMFIGGWLLARYSGYNKWFMGFFMILPGVVLVAITILPGG